MKCIIKYIGKSLNLFESKPEIKLEIINGIFNTLVKCSEKVKEKINSLYNLFKNDKDGIYDANDKSDQNSDIFQLQKTYKYINILYKSFHNLDGIIFVKIGEGLLKFYTTLWQEEEKSLTEKNQNNEEKLKEVLENSIAMCINFYNIFLEHSDEKSFRDYSLEYFLKTYEIQEGENIISNIVEGYGIICERVDNSLFEEKFSNIMKYITKILQRNITSKNRTTHDKAIRALGKFIYYKCDVSNKLNDDEKIEYTNNFLKLLPATNDLIESDKICEELFDQITEEKCKLLLDEKTEEETKGAVYRIIELNSKENFINDLTKLLKTSLTLGLNFSNLVD